MTTDETISDPGRGGLKAVRWGRFLRDHEAVREAARTHRVVLNTYSADELRTDGVGVVQLWPPSVPPSRRQTPLGVQAFQATFAPPGACLWAAATTRERITDSVHIELVGDIARVCEPVDLQTDGVGREYVLSVEPVAMALARCLDIVTASAPDVELLTRLRGYFPWQWTNDQNGRPRPHRLPPEQMRDLRVRFSCTPGSSPTVIDDIRTHCADVPALPETPARADVAAVLDAFFAGGHVTD